MGKTNRKSKTITIEIQAKPLRKGHQPRRGSAGEMDNRTKRQRTRGSQFRNSLKDYN